MRKILTPSWEINSKGAVQWNVDKAQLPHKDHVEMSGEQMAFVLESICCEGLQEEG